MDVGKCWQTFRLLASRWGQRARLANGAGMVFLYGMNTAIAGGAIANMQTEPRAMIRRQVSELFDWIDRFLDVHRSTFVFREPTQEQLAQHKRAFQLGIRTCLFFNALIADPDFNEPELAARLQVRIRQLQDAYDTFHESGLSDEQAGKILQKVFPE